MPRHAPEGVFSIPAATNRVCSVTCGSEAIHLSQELQLVFRGRRGRGLVLKSQFLVFKDVTPLLLLAWLGAELMNKSR